jgi:hypothetical protein
VAVRRVTFREWYDEVDVIERHFIMKRHVRKKYRCRCVEMALMPRRLVPGATDLAVPPAP